MLIPINLAPALIICFNSSYLSIAFIVDQFKMNGFSEMGSSLKNHSIYRNVESRFNILCNVNHFLLNWHVWELRLLSFGLNNNISNDLEWIMMLRLSVLRSWCKSTWCSSDWVPMFNLWLFCTVQMLCRTSLSVFPRVVPNSDSNPEWSLSLAKAKRMTSCDYQLPVCGWRE